MDLSDIRELYDYNDWADQRVLAAAAKLDQGAFTRPLGNSFSSVRDTLAHILSGEWIWLERWQGRFPTALLNADNFPTVDSLRKRWMTVSKDCEAFIETLSAGNLQSSLAYLNRAGERFAYPLWQQMTHVVNHSSYHRGQVTTLLRQLGAEPVGTDFLSYYDEKSQRTG
jgi:uncharacterized damage-inducible protein DinB